MNLRILAFCLFILGLLALDTAVENDWTLKKTGDRMWIYTRDRQGSEIKEVRLVMNVEASIPAINEVLDNAERQTEWVYRCSEAKDLGGTIDTGWYYYSRIEMPWPMDDRDLVAKVVGRQEDMYYESNTIATPEHLSNVKGCVRLTDFDVRTRYVVNPDGTTQMTYDLHSEPGGAVPSWLVNMFIDKGPVETMTRLRKLVENTP